MHVFMHTDVCMYVSIPHVSISLPTRVSCTPSHPSHVSHARVTSRARVDVVDVCVPV